MRLIALLALLAVPVFAVPDSTNGWGYDLDSLDRDLAVWKAHPDVRIDSIGASVQGRPIWMVSITDRSDSVAPVSGRAGPKRRVVAHARTHPWEVQSQRVANGMIAALLEPTDEAAALRRDFLFHFIPQYNPDGIVLGSQRFNANGVDLEGNWSAPVMEPEAASLKRLFQGFMAGANPVDVALNLHSDQFNCTRFFFYHLPGGTSELYAAQEKTFIADIQARFPGGIEDWNFVASWATAPVLRYPEGFWWSGWREKVMALTYEDANCPDAGLFDSTGRALVEGTGAYLRQVPQAAEHKADSRSLRLEGAEIVFGGELGGCRWETRDAKGRRMTTGIVSSTSLKVSDIVPPGRGMSVFLVRRPDGGLERILLSPR